jgi:hypothetical protein
MFARLTIHFSEDERKALEEISLRELRPLKEQIRFIVRADLERRGLLAPQEEEGVKDEPTK